MRSAEFQSGPHVLFLNENSSLVSLVRDAFAVEEIAIEVATTATQAFSALSNHSGNSIVLIDNLQVHIEGQQFLEQLRHEPTLRSQLRTICMAVHLNCVGAREVYGDVLDEYLEMPFTMRQLLEALQID